MEHDKILFCKGGGCTAKLGPDVLSRVLSKLERGDSPNLLVGFDASDDAAVYQINEDTALVSTLDFFPPMVEDPYLFGKIAAANALSDVYAMGGQVLTALNIVCFPQDGDLNLLGEILQGGAEMVVSAGGVLCGGHSINDADVKYGLSVNGIVHPDKIYRNNTAGSGDVLILTKPLGVGIICTADRVGKASQSAMDDAIRSMTTLNKRAAELSRGYRIHACTDVTGFGLLCHLHEMLGGRLKAVIDSMKLPYIKEAFDYANDFLLTAAAQRNRNHVELYVEFMKIPFAMEELLFDPQTSGGLLYAVAPEDAAGFLQALQSDGIPAREIGMILPKEAFGYYKEITVL